MSVVEVLRQLGGVATRQQLVEATSRAEVDRAVDEGAVLVEARGRYALPVADEARRAAHRLTGVVGLLSAALHHGWAVRMPPALPQVVLPRNRKVAPGRAAGVEVVHLELHGDDVLDGVTTQDRTLVDVARRYPDADALAVLDSALRDGFSHARLVALARDARGPHVRRVRRLVARASGLAANPFESALRSIADEVDGLRVRPQVPLFGSDFLGRPDLVDLDLRIVVEAESFEWHGDRAALRADARRFNALSVHGWLVLRFSWEDVMFHPDQVRSVLTAAVAERTKMRCSCGSAA